MKRFPNNDFDRLVNGVNRMALKFKELRNNFSDIIDPEIYVLLQNIEDSLWFKHLNYFRKYQEDEFTKSNGVAIISKQGLTILNGPSKESLDDLKKLYNYCHEIYKPKLHTHKPFDYEKYVCQNKSLVKQ